MKISVVIPTHNRQKILTQCLQALFEQDLKKSEYEIIVVDDGSSDETEDLLKKMQEKSPVDFSFYRQKNSGQGVARNCGIAQARGEIILLIGDDIIATHQLLREHLCMHERHPEESAAVLGFITWHPKLSITPLMKFMERGGAIFGRFGGHQFAFDLLEGKEHADYRFFYTSNISLKRSVLVQHKFDPWFSGYGFEDIELGYRLTQKMGLNIYYEPMAIAYHDHPMNTNQFEQRMKDIGRSVASISKKYPELALAPSARKIGVFKFLGNAFVLRLIKLLWQNLYFYALSKKYFMEGLEAGYNKESSKFEIKNT